MNSYANQEFAPFSFQLGILWVACSNHGISRSSFDKPEKTIDHLPSPFQEAVETALSSGNSTSIQFDLDGLSGFTKEVLMAVCHIPYGKTDSYASLAATIGHPRAARAVGNAVGSNPIPVLIPCHRVVRSNGELGGYACGTDIKRMLLAAESGPTPASMPRRLPRLFHTTPSSLVVHV